jgi:hypothetical protein
MRRILIAAIGGLCLYGSALVYAQNDAAPVCVASYMDADGDGFGWTGTESCVVTDQSHPKPEYTNQQTGARVELVRAYWDPNSDIADRNIRCEFFRFNSDTAMYERHPDAWGDFSPDVVWARDNVFYHLPLAVTETQRSAAYAKWNTMYYTSAQQLPENLTTDPPAESLYPISVAGDFETRLITGNAKPPLWTVVDGVYKGISPLAENPYVEITDYAGQPRNAVRVWDWNPDCSRLNCPMQPTDHFHLCHALDRQPFLPTGTAGLPGTALDHLDETILVSIADDELTTMPIISRESGLPIEFMQGHWNYNTTIAGQHVTCMQHMFDAQSGTYELNNLDLSNWISETLFHPYNGGDSVLVSSRYPANEYPTWWYTEKVPLQNGVLGNTWLLRSTMERTDNGFNTWFDDDQYESCNATPEFMPLADSAIAPDQADATDSNGSVNNVGAQTDDSATPTTNSTDVVADNSSTQLPAPTAPTEPQITATSTGGGTLSLGWLLSMLVLTMLNVAARRGRPNAYISTTVPVNGCPFVNKALR